MSTESIKKYISFIKQYHKKDLIRQKNGEVNFIPISINKLSEFNFELADDFLQNPQDHLLMIAQCLESLKEHADDNNFKYRIVDIPETEIIAINELRKEHVNKIVSIKGMIKRKSDVFPKTDELVYLCTNPSCNFSEEKIRIFQTGKTKKTIKTCLKCKSAVELIKEIDIDFQVIMLEEKIDDLDNPNIMPKIREVHLENDLTTPLMDNQHLIGSNVEIIGLVKKKVIESQRGDNLISELYVHALNIKGTNEEKIDITITKEDEAKIKELSKKDNLMEILTESIAPNIAGRNKQKEASLYFCVGGNENQNERKHIHLAVIGNPSLGKSKILKRLAKFLPRTVYADGGNSSKAGLTGAAVKDELSGGWTIEAGAISLANKGYFFLDEADKMKLEDETNLNEALEHQTISINKIVKGQLSADCPCYIAANPKKGKFDDNVEYAKQIRFDPTFLSRFDLIFILSDEEGEKEKDSVIDKLLGINTNNIDYLDDDFLRKYLFYAKRYNPKIPDELKLRIKTYYQTISAKAKNSTNILITYRQLGALIRLSEARAKLHLREKVILADIQAVMDLMNYCLNKLGISEISTGISNKTRGNLKAVESAIEELSGKQEYFTIEEIKIRAKAYNPSISEMQIDKTIEEMKRESVIFEPKKNQYKKC